MIAQTTVSLCLIVKNEADLILSCLESVKDLVDEIILVDTGSTDTTLQLAAVAGAKVFHFTWTGDFARARNFALEQAVCHWILVLDADEILEPVSRAAFQQLLCNSNIEGYFLPIVNLLDDGRETSMDQVVRLFRNKETYRFTGAIHEQVAASIIQTNDGGGLAVAPLVIKHFGYLKDQIIKKNKFQRNTSIISRALMKHPGDPFLLYSLANEHYQKGNVSAGLNCLEKALKRLQGTEGYYEDVVLKTALGLLETGKYIRLINFIEKFLQAYPQHSDFFLLRGLGHFHRGEYSAAARDLEIALEGKNKLLPDYRILSLAGDVYNLAGNYDMAEKSYLTALYRCSRLLYPLTRILNLIRQNKIAADFAALSRFTTIPEKRNIMLELINSQEVPLALIILLLTMYELIMGEIRDNTLLQLYHDITETLPLLKPILKDNEIISYLNVTEQEIGAYSITITKGYDCPSFPAGKKLKILIEKTLLLLITELGQLWNSQPCNSKITAQRGDLSE